MVNHVSEILPGLFLGNQRDSKDTSQLQAHGITHLVSLLPNPKQDFPNKFYLCIQIADEHNDSIAEFISPVNDFIHESRHKNNKVLVFCKHGVSLSVAFVMAYIMTIAKLDWYSALNVVRAEVTFALPVAELLKQLELFQKTMLYVERCRLQFKFSSKMEDTNDMKTCLTALTYYDRLLRMNPNLFESVPDLKDVFLPNADIALASGKKKRRGSLLLDTFILNPKGIVNGSVKIADKIMLYMPLVPKENDNKGRFVDPIDGRKKR